MPHASLARGKNLVDLRGQRRTGGEGEGQVTSGSWSRLRFDGQSQLTIGCGSLFGSFFLIVTRLPRFFFLRGDDLKRRVRGSRGVGWGRVEWGFATKFEYFEKI